MMAENCAESAITLTPQTSEWITNAGKFRKNMPARMQQAPLATMEMIVTQERCWTAASCVADFALSLAAPAHQHPKKPMAITLNAQARTTSGRSGWLAFAAAASSTATHPQSEYSSHIWPR